MELEEQLRRRSMGLGLELEQHGLDHELHHHQQRKLGSQLELEQRNRCNHKLEQLHKLVGRLELERSTKEHPSSRRSHGRDDDGDDDDDHGSRRRNQERPSIRYRCNHGSRDQRQQRCRCRTSRNQQLRPRSQYQQKKHDS